MIQTPTRRWTAAGLGLCVLLAIAGWFLVVGPQRSQAAANWDELSAAQTQTAALRSRVNVLKTRFEGIDAARAALDLKRQSLPATNALDTLVLALNDAAAKTGVTVDAVTPAEPVDITPVPPPPPKVEDSDAPEEDGEAPPAAAPPVAIFPLFELPVTIRATGSSHEIQDFMAAVQADQPRAILITSFILSPGLSGLTLDEVVVLEAQTHVFVSPVTPSAIVAPAP